MRLAIIGLPQSGKTTIFNALTQGDRPVTTSGRRFDIHTAIVNVPDPRVKRLSTLFKPKKTTFAKVEYADVAGLDGSAGENGISGSLLNQLSQMDGFLHVVRAFEDEVVHHVQGRVNPVNDIDAIESELLINDLIAIERKLERLADERRRGVGRDKAEVARETALFERLQQVVSENTPLREFDLSAEEERIISGFGFLTRKPILHVVNLGDEQAPPTISSLNGTRVDLQGKLEMEIAQLPADEAEMFLEEYGIDEPSLSRMIRHSYDLLGLQSFFTVGEDEVRAWTVRRGATAPEAAGVIHSDLQKGFIRADVITCNELLGLGGMSQARASGKLRLEGKTYPVQDGDIVHIRFNV